ncbi:MAG: rRNA maturation RNase YbeY [Clostridia bacterium]|nr:MAG: rRNA maturation RNase YbeY [Clostridia bacterium]
MTIEIDIDEAYLPFVSPHRLSKAVQAVLDAESAVGDVTVFITDDDAVAELNQRFLGIDGATDVLSFPAQGEESNFVLPPDLATIPYLGDIVIAFPYTQRQARRLNRPLMPELMLLVVHGALHLLGYDHTTPDEKAEMWARQDTILGALHVRG